MLVGRNRAPQYAQPPGLPEIYAQHADFVFRNLRRLGVIESAIDDAVQDVFLVVHRRLGDFEARAQVTTWLFGIVLRVAQSYRRSAMRRRARLSDTPASDIEQVPVSTAESPIELLERREASTLLHRLLDELDDDKRAMLVCVELEQMTVPEAAESLGLNLNTAYGRLRAARATFNDAVARTQKQMAERAERAGRDFQ
ncbi:MAG TPA: sigma-70 family RNA polymerase sigma factor [Polyangia bacterium]|nr:sigma-70 family RNA polymerase sigma factor [Polyangia bacterium]